MSPCVRRHDVVPAAQLRDVESLALGAVEKAQITLEAQRDGSLTNLPVRDARGFDPSLFRVRTSKDLPSEPSGNANALGEQDFRRVMRGYTRPRTNKQLFTFKMHHYFFFRGGGW